MVEFKWKIKILLKYSRQGIPTIVGFFKLLLKSEGRKNFLPYIWSKLNTLNDGNCFK